jgi:hypothetical protein
MDTLFGLGGADWLGSGAGLLDYFGPASPDATILSTYAARCPAGPGQAACEDTLRLRLTAGACIALKNAMVLAAREPGCPYYNDVHAIVQRPAIPAAALADPAAYQSGLAASSCNNACAGSVAAWMAALDARCPALAGNPAARAQLQAALFDFCLAGCPNGNPLALPTAAHIANGMYGIGDAINPDDPARPGGQVQACLDQLTAQATLQAQALYQAVLDSLLQAALTQAAALCRARPPMHESLTMTHTPRVYQYTFEAATFMWTMGYRIPGYYPFEVNSNAGTIYPNSIKKMPHVDYPPSLLAQFQ